MIRAIWLRAFVPRLLLFIPLLALFACEDDPSSPADTTAPGAVGDLAVVGEEDTLVVLAWSAPGDEGESAKAGTYDLRYSSFAITEEVWEGAGGPQRQPVCRWRLHYRRGHPSSFVARWND